MTVPKSFAGLSLASDGVSAPLDRRENGVSTPLDRRGGPLDRRGDGGWQSPEGIEIKPRYDARDLEGLDALDASPGLIHHTCAGLPDHYRPSPRRSGEYAGFSTAEESNAAPARPRRGPEGSVRGLDLAARAAPTPTPRVRGDVTR